MTDTTPNDPDIIRTVWIDVDQIRRYKGHVAKSTIIALCDEVDRLRRHQLPAGGEWDVQYGVTNQNAKFNQHGDETQAREVARILNQPIVKRDVWYGPVQPITETDTP